MADREPGSCHRCRQKFKTNEISISSARCIDCDAETRLGISKEDRVEWTPLGDKPRIYKVTLVEDLGDRWRVWGEGSKRGRKTTGFTTTWMKTEQPKVRKIRDA